MAHWDGLAWEWVDWPDMGDDSDRCRESGEEIEGMWGADGVLFVHSDHELAMWDGADVSVIGYWPGEEVVSPDDLTWDCEGQIYITGIWGNTPDEVFLAVKAGPHIGPFPPLEHLLWWDGSDFHWF